MAELKIKIYQIKDEIVKEELRDELAKFTASFQKTIMKLQKGIK